MHPNPIPATCWTTCANTAGQIFRGGFCGRMCVMHWTLNNGRGGRTVRRELHFLKAGRNRGLFLSQLGARVGVGNQGVLDRVDRLEALLATTNPMRKPLARRGARNASGAGGCPSKRPGLPPGAMTCTRSSPVWLSRPIVFTSRSLSGSTRWRSTAATMVILDLAAAELRTPPAALGLEATRPCTVHTLLARADNLRRQFARVGLQDCTLRTRVVRRQQRTRPVCEDQHLCSHSPESRILRSRL